MDDHRGKRPREQDAERPDLEERVDVEVLDLAQPKPEVVQGVERPAAVCEVADPRRDESAQHAADREAERRAGPVTTEQDGGESTEDTRSDAEEQEVEVGAELG